MDRFAEAEQMYRFVIVEDPQYGNAHIGLAFALAEQGKIKESVAVLRSPKASQALSRVGSEVVAGSPEEFAALIRTEIAKWAKVIKAAGIQPE